MYNNLLSQIDQYLFQANTTKPIKPKTWTKEQIAQLYADVLNEKTNSNNPVSKFHLTFADAVLNRDHQVLKYLANGLNDTGKNVFTQVTGVKLPKGQGDTWKTILKWAGVDPQDVEDKEKLDKATKEFDRASKKVSATKIRQAEDGQIVTCKEYIDNMFNRGFNTVVKKGRNTYLYNPKTDNALNLSLKGYGDMQTYAIAKFELEKLSNGT